MEFLSEYASFLAKTLTLVVAIVVVLVAIAATRSRGRRGSGQLQVQKLNDFYKDLRERLEHSVLSKDQLKATRKAQAKACLLYTSPSPRDRTRSRMPSSA